MRYLVSAGEMYSWQHYSENTAEEALKNFIQTLGDMRV